MDIFQNTVILILVMSLFTLLNGYLNFKMFKFRNSSNIKLYTIVVTTITLLQIIVGIIITLINLLFSMRYYFKKYSC